tara:strand:- start:283 stop:831 length:549 start_codon:yes stop_codon:yes gene_type:complete
MIKKEKYFYLNSIQDLDLDYIKKTNANLILRDQTKFTYNQCHSFILACKNKRIKVYIANNLKLMFKLRLNNFYVSSKNKKNYLNLRQINKKINIIGGAHNINEIMQKRMQGCNKIILSRLFNTNKNGFYGVVKFNKITLNKKLKYIALGGINEANYKKLCMVNCEGIAMLSSPLKRPSFLRA